MYRPTSSFGNPGVFALVILVLAAWGQGCGTGGLMDPDLAEQSPSWGGSDAQSARTLFPGITQQGYIEYVGDVDWYRLEIPPGADTVRFELTNQALRTPVDLSLTVYAEDGTTILGARHDPDGEDGLTQITLELAVRGLETCYAVVRDHLGDDADPVNPYFLKAILSSGPGDGNNSPDSASLVQCGEVVQDAIETLTDVDWFRVRMPATADILAYSLTMPPGTPDLVLTLYDSTATTAIVSLSHREGWRGPTLLSRNVRLAEPGDYYLSVRDNLYDDADPGLLYDLAVDCLADPDPNEPNGNFATTAENLSNATPLPLDTWVSGWIAFHGDEDWYRLSMPQDGLLNLFVRTTAGGMPVDLLCTLLGADGESVKRQFVVAAGTDPTDIAIRVALPSGVHYLRVEDAGGDNSDLVNSYSVRATFEPDPDPNEPNGNFPSQQENRNHATPLVLGVPAIGYIGFHADQDWFQVFVANPGVYHFSLSNAEASEVDLSLSLYRPTLNGLDMILTRSERDGGNGPTSIEAQLYLFHSGTYYILVQDLHNDDSDLHVPYRIEVNAVPLPPGSNEPNEDRTQYVPIVSGQRVQGYIEFEGDRDWYGLDIQGDVNVLVEIWNEAPSPVDFVWFMFEPDSTRVVASGGDATESDNNLIYIVTGDDEEFWVGEERSGLYLFRITDFNRNDWDTEVPYNFRVTLTPRVP